MIRGQSGQAIFEFIILLALFLALTMYVAKEFKEREIFAELVSGPWKQLDGMVANGHWGARDESNQYHPNLFFRHVSLRGQEQR